jgi:hypothetical protein
MKKWFFSPVFIVLLLGLCGESVFAGCLTSHLREAITLNQKRKPIYSHLTSGKSEAVSDSLIKMEREMMLQAVFGDVMSSYWRSNGVPLLCSEIISMDEVPGFKSERPSESGGENAAEHLSTLREVDLRVEALREKLRTKNYRSLEQLADQFVKDLEHFSQFNCLQRHFLESIRRAAGLVLVHHRASQEMNLGSTLWLSRMFISGQIALLKKSQEIDSMAFPIQQQGVPIICQDIPIIPPWSSASQ